MDEKIDTSTNSVETKEPAEKSEIVEKILKLKAQCKKCGKRVWIAKIDGIMKTICLVCKE